MKAMILAAGLGKRLRPLTNTIPKPNLMVGDKSLIQRNIEKLISSGFKEIVINISHLGHKIKEHVCENFSDIEISFSEESEPLGTGGGVKKALNLLGEEPFLLLNADIYHLIDLNIAHHDVEFAHIIGVPNPEHNLKGDFSLDGTKVSIKKNSNNEFTWSGISIINPVIFNDTNNLITPYSIWGSVIKKYIQDAKVTAEISQKTWIDTGTIERLGLANKSFKEEN